MNLFWREMKAARKSLIAWCIGMLLMVIAGMSKYGGISNSSQSLNEMMKQMPKSLQAILGVGSLDLSTTIGYFGMLFLYLVLIGTIHALILGAGIISKEERDKTSEFLMTKPISRTKIISFKLLAALANVTILNLVTCLSSAYMIVYYSDGEAKTVEMILLMAGLYFLQLIFLAVGTGIAAVSNKPKSSVSVGTGILLFTFILSIVIELNSKLENLKYATPFKYFEASQILIDKELNLTFITLSLIIIGFISITYIYYQKRDLMN